MIRGVLKMAVGSILLCVAALMLPGCATTPRKPPPTVEEIVQLSHNGVPPQQIIQTIRETHGVYRLPASELAKLKERGVADPVLDYMQQTYLDDERWRAYYQAGPYWGPYGYWWGPPPVIVVRHK
jgi:hypothetical protein